MVATSSHRNGTILVVDDEEQVRKLTCLILEREGYRVLAAASGAEALIIARGPNSPIDLLLTDMEMPGMDGLELSHRIVAALPGTRVLLNSANTYYAQQQEFPFLAKPFSPEKLRSAVIQAMAPVEHVIVAVDQHVDRNLLELYSRNLLPEAEREHYEEHLRMCAACRETHRAYNPVASAIPVAATTDAEAPAAGARRSGLLRAAPFWAVGGIVVALVLWGLYQFGRTSSEPPVSLSLHAVRGGGGTAVAGVGRPLHLNLDLSGLPPRNAYRVELSRDTGRIIWTQIVSTRDSAVQVASDALPRGLYFVRLYVPEGEPAREFAFRVGGGR